MEVTEVRIKLMDEPGERLKAFCSITFDNCFVVRDLKIIEGASGPFVAMPSRKLTAHCPRCGMKNHLRAPYCNQCGSELSMDRTPVDAEGRAKLYADIAHPINSACREMIQNRVISEYEAELIRAQEPGYVSRYDDFDLDYVEPRRPAATHSGETRFDAPHSRAAAGRNSDPAETQRSRPGRSSPPPPKGPHLTPEPGPAAAKPRHADQFGAGIFPED